MYRTIRYLACWTKLLHSPLGVKSGLVSCNLPQTDRQTRAAYSSGPPWTHTGDRGVDYWHKWYPTANGEQQSPIALYSDSPHHALELQLNGYRNPAGLTAVNIGPTVSFKSDCAKMVNSPCYINGVHGWWEKYCFNHVHMHWGRTSEEGSEHTIDDKRFPMELHIVHCLGNLSLSAACGRPKGLAVLAFMYEISEEDNPAYTPLLDAMEHVKYKGEETRVKSSPSLTIASLLPASIHTGYFYYSGSLTMPPCSEVVQWMVFSDPIAISENQMGVFRAMQRCSDICCVEPMSGNWRPLQPVRDRQVFQSKTIDIRTGK